MAQLQFVQRFEIALLTKQVALCSGIVEVAKVVCGANENLIALEEYVRHQSTQRIAASRRLDEAGVRSGRGRI